MNSEDEDDRKTRKLFKINFIVAQVVGLLSFIFIVALAAGFDNGGIRLKTDQTKVENFHMVLMTTFMVLVLGLGNSAFRVISPNLKKSTVKYIHAGVHISTLVVGLSGVLVIFLLKDERQYSQFASFHAQVGLSTMIFYFFQVLQGTIIYLLPCTPWWLKISIMQYHTFGGTLIFVLAVTSAISGLSARIPKLLNTLQIKGPKAEIISEEKFANSIFLLLIFYLALMIHLMMESRFRRKSPPEGPVTEIREENNNNLKDSLPIAPTNQATDERSSLKSPEN